jgi:hypothetical protein
LKAVSFLGASIPQVKGMKAVEFKEGESDTYIFETAIQDSEEDEDTEVLKATIDDLTKQVADFKEKAKKNTEIKDLKSQVKDLSIQLAKFKDDAAGKDELAKELKDIKDNLRTKDFNEFIAKQIETGTLTPAQKDAVFSILCDLDNVKKFDDASNSIEDFKTLITAMPKQIEFSEVATKKKSTTKVDEEKYADADEESVEIYKQAKALAKKENISFKDALLKIKEI